MQVRISLKDIIRVQLTEAGMDMLKEYIYVQPEGTVNLEQFQMKGRPEHFQFSLLQLLIIFGGEDLQLATETDQQAFLDDEIVVVKKKK